MRPRRKNPDTAVKRAILRVAGELGIDRKRISACLDVDEQGRWAWTVVAHVKVGEVWPLASADAPTINEAASRVIQNVKDRRMMAADEED